MGTQTTMGWRAAVNSGPWTYQSPDNGTVTVKVSQDGSSLFENPGIYVWNEVLGGDQLHLISGNDFVVAGNPLTVTITPDNTT